MKTKAMFSMVLLLVFLFFAFWGCTDKYQPTPSQFASSESGCTSCHTNANLLKQVATPLPPPSGESGEG